MVLDTGSELSWLLCNSSGNAPFFEPRRSSSSYAIPCSSPTCRDRTRDLPIPATCDDNVSHLCHVSLSYADASTSEGTLAIDSFLVGISLPLPTVFGCMASTYSSAAGDPSAAGVLGMNRGALSFVTQTAIRRFSYCIAAGSGSLGVLLLGDVNPPFVLLLNYTPLIQISLPLPYFDRVAYSVPLEGILVADFLLPIPKSVLVPDHTGAGQTMMDSGTQFTFLLGPAYEALKVEFVRRTTGLLVPLNEPDFVFQGAFDLCFRVPAERGPPQEGLPAVVLMFGGGAEVRVEGGEWLLYDLDNGHVGFVPVRCDLASQRLGDWS